MVPNSQISNSILSFTSPTLVSKQIEYVKNVKIIEYIFMNFHLIGQITYKAENSLDRKYGQKHETPLDFVAFFKNFYTILKS